MAVTKSFDVEFDDALLDLAGWKNPRYEGSKLTGKFINQYTGITKGTQVGDPDHYAGDTTYGLNPVITNKTIALYIGNTLVGADGEQDKFVDINGHSYVSIDKVLVINPETDELQLIEKRDMDTEAWSRLITTDFPEGSQVGVRLLDYSIQNNLKDSHYVKFNKGTLMKLYKYTANTGGFEDGVFGGFGIRAHATQSSQHTGSFNGLGFFGYGMTCAVSRSLFTTNSIQFAEELPSELSIYAGDLNLEIMGSELAPLSASLDPAQQQSGQYASK